MGVGASVETRRQARRETETETRPAPRPLRVTLVGAGEMAESLVRGWLAAGALAPGAVAVTNRRDDERLATFRDAFGVRAERPKAAVVPEADVVILAVKPQDMAVALDETAPHLTPGATVVSVAAGVPISALAGRLPAGTPVIRAMPNAAARVGRAVTALAAAPGARGRALERALWLFSQVGLALELPEELFDAFTAVAGSGPAYAYLLVEAMAQAGERLGLPADVARRAAWGALSGAAAMLAATGLPPHELRRQVTSPGGTTEAALGVLQEMGVPKAVALAVRRAAERAAALGRRLAPDRG